MSFTDQLPTIAVTLVLGYAVYHFFLKKEETAEDRFLKDRPLLSSNNLKKKKPAKINTRNFIERMNKGDRTMIIFYGSQTGTAEEFAFRISQNARRYGIKSLVLNPDDCDFEEIGNMTRDLDLTKNITIQQNAPQKLIMNRFSINLKDFITIILYHISIFSKV